MRISIIGLPGSGKSTLARILSEKLGIPRIELDRLWFASDGHKLPRGDEVGRQRVRAYVLKNAQHFITGESWVCDGLYSRIQPEIAARADVLIFLDIPLWRRLANHFIRVFKRSERHPEIPFWQDFWFFIELIRRTYKSGPKMRKLVAEYQDKVVTIRSHTEANDYALSLSRQG